PREPFVAVSTNHRPIECPAFLDIELRLDDVEVNGQLPIELCLKSMLDDLIGNPGKDHQNHAHRGHVPHRESRLERSVAPPMAQGAHIRRPTPRMVRNSLTGCPSSIFRRRCARWTSMTLSSGVARGASRQTDSASIARVTTCP